MTLQNPEDSFVFIREIGTGSYGKCMLCERKTDGSKIVMKKVALNEESKEEAYILNRIRHDNIVRIFQSYASQRNIYMVLEYMPGGTLANMIKHFEDRPIKDKHIGNLSSQLARALECLHGMHIIHRDVKPANMLLSADRKLLKLCDFGIAVQLKEGKKTKGGFHNIGTINYMAPEIIEGLEYDQKSDMWSFGCVIYEMVERTKAFPGVQQLAVYHKICHRIVVIPEHSKFSDIIKSLLIISPDQRPTAKKVLDLLSQQNKVSGNSISNAGNSLVDLFKKVRNGNQLFEAST